MSTTGGGAGARPPGTAAEPLPGAASQPSERHRRAGTPGSSGRPGTQAEGSGSGALPGAGGRGRPTTGRLWTRLGLRARVTVMFGLGALLVSASMGGLSYFTARHFLLSERDDASVHQAYVNASLLRTAVGSGSHQIDQLLASLDSGSGSQSVLRYGGKTYSSSLSVGQDAIPAPMQALVRSGTPATQTYLLNGSPQLVVGIPVVSVHASYFEVFDLGDLSHTLGVLQLALMTAGLITTLLGAAVGRSASNRSLRPLTAVSQAAVAIAEGQLDTRLAEVDADPDLYGLSRAFNTMVDQLSVRIEREARFTSDVSHELRSPLTTLSASLEVLETQSDHFSERARHALVLLGADLRRFQRMVGDLLEISRSDTGSADIFLEEVAAAELVRRSVTAGSRVLPEGVPAPRVVIDPTGSALRVDVDKRRFERVVANLMENAAYYAGGATVVTVAGGLPRADGWPTADIMVDDGGPGIPATERARIFERFYRGPESGRRGTSTGTGLGLALVAEHVRLMGGTVRADEAPGGGARFVIELPLSGGEAPW